ncbi:uncharacterized protein J7T54_000627 [Emericellopsis cladophorae]|uniref:Uncharacterized protein n=1 Tax=Emericellopsis cladophorae TaxID=2686198 RepID=A0A9Q0BFY5_9HYPO|nr:uncharacterized protein J7T54_000627 [Emericellopsis cladophorae]KAI6783125.1 hypothetical protein J7T54_000627 [Emericellopsis cladophorae]
MAAFQRNLAIAAVFMFTCISIIYLVPILSGDQSSLLGYIHHKAGFDPPEAVNLVPTKVADGETTVASITTAKTTSTSVTNPAVSVPAPPEGKISRLHYLIPASQPNLHLCYNLASSAANRYPVPALLGFHGQGEWDAKKTHLAKLRAIMRYLDALDAADDEDLAIIVDGYDVLLQLPPAIMIERYFEVAQKSDAHLADRFGLTVKELHARGMRQSVFWGPDKICWPTDPRASRCWAVPASPLAPDAFGPKEGNGDMAFNDPRWLNSGTVIARIDDLRKLMRATLDEIKDTYDEEYEFRESDQYYVANIWGRQEYYRSLAVNEGEPVAGGPDDRIIPDKFHEDQETECHVSLDYESAMFQTKAGNEPWFGYLEFSTSGLNANVTRDMFDEGDSFVPFDISMPANVYAALTRLYDTVPQAHPGASSNDWIRSIRLGVNFVTKHIFPLWHCTGAKEFVESEYTKLWFYPFAHSLIRATVNAFRQGELITYHKVDGRLWAPKGVYPDETEMDDELGGAWTDLDGASFVPWHELCSEYTDQLFAGELPRSKKP